VQPSPPRWPLGGEIREARGLSLVFGLTRAAAVLVYDPKAADEFFRSVRGAFQKNEQHASSTGYFLLALVATAGLLALVRPEIQKRRLGRGQRRALEHLAAARGLSQDDLGLLAILADHSGTHAVVVATHIDVFERATAGELRGLPPTIRVRKGSLHARLHDLRGRLQFGAHTDHDALLTTREARPGYGVEILGTKTMVNEVNEAYYSLVVPERPAASVGAKLPLIILHDREASYSVASPLLAVESTNPGWTLFLAHDEAPARQQQRQFVRVQAGGPIELSITADPASDRKADPIQGTLLDVSLQGVAVSLREKLAARAQGRLSFSFRNETFGYLDVAVLECEGPPAGPFRLRLQFRGLSHGDERRLGAAIAQATTRRSSLPTSLRP
jgi:hypothetical protein